jgi:hypothetical protein
MNEALLLIGIFLLGAATGAGLLLLIIRGATRDVIGRKLW